MQRTRVFRGTPPPSQPPPPPDPRPRCVPTLRLAAQGEVRILGQPRQGLLADDAELAARLSVGMVFQNGALFDSLTVGENVGFLLYEHTRLPDRRIRVRPRGARAPGNTHDAAGRARRASRPPVPPPSPPRLAATSGSRLRRARHGPGAPAGVARAAARAGRPERGG